MRITIDKQAVDPESALGRLIVAILRGELDEELEERLGEGGRDWLRAELEVLLRGGGE